jgi:hypothetical protein
MLQFVANPRSSRIVKSVDLDRYRRTATYRRAKARERRDFLADLFGFLALLGFGLALVVAAQGLREVL